MTFLSSKKKLPQLTTSWLTLTRLTLIHLCYFDCTSHTRARLESFDLLVRFNCPLEQLSTNAIASACVPFISVTIRAFHYSIFRLFSVTFQSCIVTENRKWPLIEAIRVGLGRCRDNSGSFKVLRSSVVLKMA